jgi:molybdopterin-guanine dinucleotide biosynthesis protein A
MTLTAVLLAGGESRRMGRDKALLRIDGRPLWRRQWKLLQSLAPETLLVSARSRPDWCPPELDVVLDEPPSRGPLSGLVAVLARLRTTHLLALGIDLPCMTTTMLLRLWESAQPGRGVVPQTDDGFEGLCAVYPAESGPAAAAALARNDLALRTLLGALIRQQRLTVMPLEPSEQALFLNVNTPSDFPASGADGL